MKYKKSLKYLLFIYAAQGLNIHAMDNEARTAASSSSSKSFPRVAAASSSSGFFQLINNPRRSDIEQNAQPKAIDVSPLEEAIGHDPQFRTIIKALSLIQTAEHQNISVPNMAKILKTLPKAGQIELIAHIAYKLKIIDEETNQTIASNINLRNKEVELLFALLPKMFNSDIDDVENAENFLRRATSVYTFKNTPSIYRPFHSTFWFGHQYEHEKALNSLSDIIDHNINQLGDYSGKIAKTIGYIKSDNKYSITNPLTSDRMIELISNLSEFNEDRNSNLAEKCSTLATAWYNMKDPAMASNTYFNKSIILAVFLAAIVLLSPLGTVSYIAIGDHTGGLAGNFHTVYMNLKDGIPQLSQQAAQILANQQQILGNQDTQNGQLTTLSLNTNKLLNETTIIQASVKAGTQLIGATYIAAEILLTEVNNTINGKTSSRRLTGSNTVGGEQSELFAKILGQGPEAAQAIEPGMIF